MRAEVQVFGFMVTRNIQTCCILYVCIWECGNVNTYYLTLVMTMHGCSHITYTSATTIMSHLMFLRQNVAPPAPPLKPQTSPLANMFTQENNTTSVTTTTNSKGIMSMTLPAFVLLLLGLTRTAASASLESRVITDKVFVPKFIFKDKSLFSPHYDSPSVSPSFPDHGSSEESSLPRSVSVATGLNNIVKKPRLRTIFPHNAGNNSTLLSFDEGDVIILLIPDEKDGWMYGEMEKSGK